MVEERKLTREEKDELDDARDFTLAPEELPEVLDAATMGLDDEVLFQLGVWLGDRVAAITGWVWVHLSFGPGLEAPALVSADRGLAFLPMQAVAAAAEAKQDPWNPQPHAVVVMLERLEAGDRPKGEPGSYALVTP